MNRLRHKAAFTLLEMLVVVGVTSILLMLVVPAITSTLKSRKLAICAGELMDLIELARNEAMNQNSYVYLCFQENTTASGDDQIEAFYMTAKGGYSGFTGDHELLHLERASRVYRWKDLKFVPPSAVDPELLRKRFGSLKNSTLSQAPSRSILDSGKARFNMGPNAPKIEARPVIFSPQGYALFQPGLSNPIPSNVDASTPYEKFIDFCLKATVSGGEQSGPAHEAAVILNGSSGQMQLLRH